MFDATFFARAVTLLLGLWALWCAFHFVFIPALIAGFRQNLFDLRRELFLLMAEGRITATDPVYTRMRYLMNGSLRFAERVSIWRFAFTAFCMRDAIPDEPSISESIETIEDVETRGRLNVINLKLGVCYTLHVVAVSPVLWLLAVPVTLALVVVALLNRDSADDATRRITSKVEPVAEALSIDSDAHMPLAA